MGVDQVAVTNPEMSQAFYGELIGEPCSYTVTSTVDFRLYVELLVPVTTNPDGRFSVRITNQQMGTECAVLDGDTGIWKPFFEHFAGDRYKRGPHYTAQVPAGAYRVEVYNAHNVGKYVLVVGEREAFSFAEIRRVLKLIPTLKSSFFHLPPAHFLFSIIGATYIILLLLVTVLIFFLFTRFFQGAYKRCQKRRFMFLVLGIVFLLLGLATWHWFIVLWACWYLLVALF